jgi:hypothetical protein
MAGRPCGVTLRARVRQLGENPVRVSIDRLPPGVSATDVLEALSNRWEAAQRRPRSEFARHAAFPLRDVRNTTTDDSGHHLTCIARADATLDDLNRFFRTIWYLGTSTVLQLPAALPTVLRDWVAAAGDADLRAGPEHRETPVPVLVSIHEMSAAGETGNGPRSSFPPPSLPQTAVKGGGRRDRPVHATRP